MAETTVKTVLEVDGGKAIQTLRELNEQQEYLKQVLKDSKTALDNTTKGTKEYDIAMGRYQSTLVASKKATKDYNEALNLTVNSSKAAGDSYYALNQKLVQLRKDYKNLSSQERTSARGTEMLQHIQDLDRQLKGLDAGMGQFQRNVGDYAGQIGKISGLFGRAGQSASGAVNGVMGFKASLDAAAANPIIAVLTVLISALGKVKDAFKSSEDALNSITVAFSPFKSIGQATTQVFQNLAKALGKVGEKLTEWLEKTGRMTEKMRENQRIAKEEIALKNRERQIRVENAKLEMEAMSLKAEAAQKDRYTAAERLAFMEQYRQKEEQISKNELEMATRQLKLAQSISALSDNDAAANDDLADKEAAMYEATTRFHAKMVELNGQMAEFKSQIQAAGAAAKGTILDPFADEEISDGTPEYDDAREEEIRRITELGIAKLDASEAYNQKMLQQEQWLNDMLEQMAVERQRQNEENTKRRIATLNTYSSGVGAILSTVAGAWTSVINAQVKSGKISEEEAEKQFGAVKALQYGVTLINTAAAVTSALADPSQPSYVIKAVNAASALASGMASAIQISQTEFGSTAATAATTASSQAVVNAPTLITNPVTTRTLTTAEDTDLINGALQSVKVYVLENDITKAQEGKKVKVGEASF